MNEKNILMPHACQKTGWWLLLVAVLLEVTKAFLHDIDTAWYLAKCSHLLILVSLSLICLSKEKVEDEMIASLRLRAVGITSYTFLILFIILSLVLELHIFDSLGNSTPYLSEFFLVVLPVLAFGLYYIIFKGMLLRSKKEQEQ